MAIDTGACLPLFEIGVLLLILRSVLREKKSKFHFFVSLFQNHHFCILKSIDTVRIMDLDKLNLVKTQVVVWFQAQADFHYCLKKMTLASKFAKSDSKTIISLRKSMTHSVALLVCYSTYMAKVRPAGRMQPSHFVT